MTQSQQSTGQRGSFDTSWDELGWKVAYNNVQFSRFVIGPQDDETAPVVLNVYYPPNTEVEPHTHPCDYTEIITEGRIRVGKDEFGPGDVRVVLANTGYGPLVAGSQGCRALIIFRSGDHRMIPLGAAAAK